MTKSKWRDIAMALINRVSAGEVHITADEITKAQVTDNAMIIDNGKIIIQAKGLKKPIDWPDKSEVDVYYQ